MALQNAINDTQKQRVREIFDIYAHYLGLEAVETADQGLTIARGDIQAIDPTRPTGSGGTLGLFGYAIFEDPVFGPRHDSTRPTVVLDNSEQATLWGASEFGGAFFEVAMREIGRSLGLDYDTQVRAIMNRATASGMLNGTQGYVNTGELVFPGDYDILYGQLLYRPESTDIDLYEFQVTTAGELTAEIVAERQDDASLLDSYLTLYEEVSPGEYEVVARNDDYFSSDSFLRLQLDVDQPTTYVLAVTSTGNDTFDPNIPDSGIGGTSEGAYRLLLQHQPDPKHSLVDTTGQALDGDADGIAGGLYNFWFQVGETIFVDKTYSGTLAENGSLARPFTDIDEAIAEASRRIVVPAQGGVDFCDGTITLDASGNQQQLAVAETPTINAVVGSLLSEGQTFSIKDANDVTVIFTFDNPNSGTPPADAVAIRQLGTNNPLPAQEIARNIADAINVAAGTHGLAVTPTVVGRRVELDGAVLVDAYDSNPATLTITSEVETPTILAVAGSALADGQTFDVDGVTFEFYDTEIGGPAPANPVSFTASDTAETIALSIAAAITYAVNFGPLTGVTASVDFDRVILEGAGEVDVSGAPTLTVDDLDGGPETSARIGVGYGVTDSASLIQDRLLAGLSTMTSSASLSGVTVGNHATNDRIVLVDGARIDVSNHRALLTASNLVRVVGNGGTDGDEGTLVDNSEYQIGFNNAGAALPDGQELQIPQGVTFMVDAGVAIKLRQANIDAGTSSDADRSAGAIQMLGVFRPAPARLVGDDR